MESEIVFHRCHQLIERGVKVLCLTEITRDIVANYKRAAEFCEILHTEGLKGFLGMHIPEFFSALHLKQEGLKLTAKKHNQRICSITTTFV